jgi:hypothetical protein
MSVRSRSPATVVAFGLLLLVATACHRSDENTAGGAATLSVAPSPTPTIATSTGNTGSTTGASGVSGSVGTSGASGVSGASGASGAGATENVVNVFATEYRFRFEGGSVPTGRDALILDNQGHDPHELVLFQLTHGKTLADVQALIRSGVPKQPPPWVTPIGQTFAKPGTTSKPLEADLASGQTYVIACFVTTKKGVPHAALGMLDTVPLAST